MFRAYLDESGHASETGAVAIGGWVAREKDWEEFERKWTRRLRREKVTVFHMNKFESRIGEFEGWVEHRRIAFITDLAAIIKNTIRFGVGHGLIVKDWRKVVLPTMKDPFERKRGTYIFLLQSCLEYIADTNMVKLPKGEKIACIFDQNNMMSTCGLTHFMHLKQNHADLEAVYEGASFEDKRRFLPLQAADLLAYESFKHVENQVIDGGKRKPRKLLTNLETLGKRLHMGWYAEDSFNDFLRRANLETWKRSQRHLATKLHE